ncbi:MAG TPA: cytochrome c-type biogenesis protein CcmH [Solirubrobacterales bacterium]|nr:cytochrome c-type biogenesis protein CcmH [Solirubrobacterales bacterium]
MRRALLAAPPLLVAVVLLLAAPVAASSGTMANPASPKTTLPDVEDDVMCPVCGTALNLSSSPQADRERAFIRREIVAGKTKDQIKSELVAQYGTAVLAEPPKSGFDLTAWLVPGAAILLAAIAIAIGLWRWRRAGRSGGPPTAGGPPLEPTDSERLDADLARYDL